MYDRRAVLSRLAATAPIAVAGCAGRQTTATATETASPSPSASPTATETASPTPAVAAEVAVGPEGRLRFDPETVTVAVEETVRWTFESPGHNVTSLPGASEKVRNPEGAEPFASYEGDSHFSINDVETSFEHTFTVAGEYVYVCAPHADQGMVGTVVVEAT